MATKQSVLDFLQWSTYAQLASMVIDVHAGHVVLDPAEENSWRQQVARNVLKRCPGVESVEIGTQRSLAS